MEGQLGSSPVSENGEHEVPAHARSKRRGGIAWPLILIGAGVIFLLNNTGTLSWDIWWSLAQWWPLILIAVGLDILIGRRSLLGSALVAVFVIGALALGVIYTRPASGAAASLTTTTVSQGLEGANRANVDISLGAANLNIKDGAEGSDLVKGSVMLSSREQLASPQLRRSGDTANYQLRVEGNTSWPNGFNGPRISDKRWDLQFNPDVPMSMKIDAGVGSAIVDLARMKVTNLDVNAGVGNVDVTLPRIGRYTASVDAGVGRVHILIPAGVAARVWVDRGLGGFDVSSGLQRSGDHEYVTAGYDAASDRADIKVNGGIGHISIEQQAGG